MRLLAFAIVLIAPLQATAGEDTGWLPGQVLAEPSDLADSEQFLRRLLSPIAADDMSRFVEAKDRQLAPGAMAGDEQVDLFVPHQAPADGYGLLVFVPAGDQFFLPQGWRRELSRRGIVFAGLRDAGNDADVFGRRIPLVLHAHRHVLDRYDVDASRVYVAGFSGGARLAQRVALGYPDVFVGSLQFAGSVVIGNNMMAPPPSELMALFQTRTRIVLATGNLDRPNRRNDGLARERMEELCVAGVRTVSLPRLEHWTPEGRGFAKAMELLEAPDTQTDRAPMAACRQRLAARIDTALDAAAQAAEAGRYREAVAAVVAVDDAFGGLAMPRSLRLAHEIIARRDAVPDREPTGSPR